MKVYDVKLSFSLVREDNENNYLSEPNDIVRYMKDAFETNPEQESIWVILLNNRGKPKGRVMITLGTVNASLCHPREIFRSAIMAGCSSIIVCHNHPAGNPEPSSADNVITKQLREAGKIIGITLLDHVIMGNASDDPQGRGFFSYRAAGML